MKEGHEGVGSDYEGHGLDAGLGLCVESEETVLPAWGSQVRGARGQVYRGRRECIAALPGSIVP